MGVESTHIHGKFDFKENDVIKYFLFKRRFCSLSRCLIESKTIQCINIKPYQYKEVMITLPHMVEHLFPGFTEEQVGNMLVSQDVMLYKGNSGHVEVIKQEGWEDKYSAVPLVTVKDIFHHIKSWRNAFKASDFGGKRFKGI